MRALLVKVLIGIAVVVLIAVFAKSRNVVLAGLVPLFPAFTLLAHYTIGTERSMADLRLTVLFGLWALIPLGVYLGALYLLLAAHWRLGPALVIAVLLWIAAASGLLLAWSQVDPPRHQDRARAETVARPGRKVAEPHECHRSRPSASILT